MAAVSARLRELVSRGRRVVALTGAGISAESGVPTFRGGAGFWEDGSVEDLATPAGFARDPRRVWTWYEARRIQISRCAPNAGHLALARYGKIHPELRLVTQNVDGLHLAAGSERVIALHGDLFRVRCTREGVSREDRRVPLPEIPPRCDCGALLRPDVVWFGELLPEGAVEEATEAARRSELFLSIGTSAVVYPAAALPEVAKRHGAYLVEINIEETPLSPLADEVILAPAAEALPGLLGA
ncbi:MAG: NAD-dependent protein deacylase [Acidobacteria bacterium 13_1_40CM_4_69_4]|nr:MAG: NAD-dependent protein deacylase [Acidobacteria bacterium 13_1_40CM_4_69_4]